MQGTSSKVLLDSVESVVSESLDGYLLTHPQCVRLHCPCLPSAKVIVRRSVDRTKVALISGGGAGHEPAHAGFVGHGMLTAAVCGDVFASPHVKAIVAAMQYVAGINDISIPDGATSTSSSSFPGILLIVKNYTGDRLAFGLAAEIIRGFGVDVKVVYVADDVAVDGGAITGRRGLAGTVLVHKVAGALAEAGASLAEVYAAASMVSTNVWTIGASLTTCNIPGVPPSTRLSSAGSMEVGLGIHGEPGAEQLNSLPSMSDLCEKMLRMLTSHCGEDRLVAPGTVGVLLLNNLGGFSNLEMGLLARSVIAALRKKTSNVTFAIAGPVMTSLDMKGFSISLLFVPEGSAFTTALGSLSVIQCLQASTECDVWPAMAAIAAEAGVVTTAEVITTSSSTAETSVPPTESTTIAAGHDSIFVSALRSACDALIAATDQLNHLDLVAGDGDCGSTMKSIATALLGAAAYMDKGSPTLYSVLDRCAEVVGDAAGGTSGILYAIMLRAAANSVRSAATSPTDTRSSATPALLSNAFAAAAAAVQTYARTGLGDRTMLDALIPAQNALAHCVTTGSTDYNAVAEAADAGAKRTAELPPRAGRAVYVNADAVLGNEDAGARCAAIWIAAIVHASVTR